MNTTTARREGANAPALPSRRGFLGAVAGAAVLAPVGAIAAASSSDDAPFFALVAQYAKLDEEYALAGDHLRAADQAWQPFHQAEEAARKRLSDVRKAIHDEVFADKERMPGIVARFKVPEDVSGEEFAGRMTALFNHLDELADADPRGAAVLAEWRAAKASLDAVQAERLAPCEAAEDAAYKACAAAQRLIITYPVRTAEGLRAKMQAIHQYSMDPQCADEYPVHDVPSFAGIILADVERVNGVGG